MVERWLFRLPIGDVVHESHLEWRRLSTPKKFLIKAQGDSSTRILDEVA